MHFFLKPLFHLLDPLVLVVLGLGVMAFLMLKRRQRGGRWLAFFWLLLAVSSGTVAGNRLLAAIEREWAGVPDQWATLPVCDAVVCLGGGISPDPSEIIGVHLADSSARTLTSIELIRRGRAPFLMLGGGSAEYDGGPKLSESEAVKKWIETWGLVSVPIDHLGICRNTHDEAVMFAQKAAQHGWKKVILVTSASHMHRALAVFRKTTGLEVIPVACAFRTEVARGDHVEAWVHAPSTGALDDLSAWAYETIGWWVYRARGWVD